MKEDLISREAVLTKIFEEFFSSWETPDNEEDKIVQDMAYKIRDIINAMPAEEYVSKGVYNKTATELIKVKKRLEESGVPCDGKGDIKCNGCVYTEMRKLERRLNRQAEAIKWLEEKSAQEAMKTVRWP